MCEMNLEEGKTNGNRVAMPRLLRTYQYRPCTERLDWTARRQSCARPEPHEVREPQGLTVGDRAASVVEARRPAAAALGAHVCAADSAARAAAVGDAARGAACIGPCLCATPHTAREGRDAPD